MKGIAISPHILTLKPEPFTPLKRLGTPQTPVKNEENLLGFSFCAFGTVIRNITTGIVILSGKIFEKNFVVEESQMLFIEKHLQNFQNMLFILFLSPLTSTFGYPQDPF